MKKEKIAELLNYFDPVRENEFSDSDLYNQLHSLSNPYIIHSDRFEPEQLTRFEVALIFIPPANLETGRPNPVQQVREAFYRLNKVSPVLRVFDPGNMKTGNSGDDTIYILEEVCSMIFRMKGIMVIVGDDQCLTKGIFNSVKEFENNINLVHIDSRIGLAVEKGMNTPPGYLDYILDEGAPFLYNIAAVGYQTYFTDPKQLKRLDELYFEHYRLGNLRSNLEQAEPVLRDADLVSFDLSAVRLSDAPSIKNGSPNGFFSEEACQLARYAGMSDRCNTFALFGVSELPAGQQQTSQLIAQIMWYFLEGYLNRKHDFPVAQLEDYTKYVVAIDEIEFPIVFYYSVKSKRWWLEITNPSAPAGEPGKVVVACSESDYRQACNNEIPDRWWINFKKIR